MQPKSLEEKASLKYKFHVLVANKFLTGNIGDVEARPRLAEQLTQLVELIVSAIALEGNSAAVFAAGHVDDVLAVEQAGLAKTESFLRFLAPIKLDLEIF